MAVSFIFTSATRQFYSEHMVHISDHFFHIMSTSLLGLVEIDPSPSPPAGRPSMTQPRIRGVETVNGMTRVLLY